MQGLVPLCRSHQERKEMRATYHGGREDGESTMNSDARKQRTVNTQIAKARGDHTLGGLLLPYFLFWK